MGARSSQSRGPGPNKTDGHLLEYFRQNFSGGGGGTQFTPPPPQEYKQLVESLMITLLDQTFIEHTFLHHQVLLM